MGDPPETIEPKGFDEIFKMALKVRTGKPGMADFWARMAHADALDRVAKELGRFNEFLGVYDNDEAEEPDAEPTRLGDVLVEGLVGALLGAKEEMLANLPEALREKAEEHFMRQLFGPIGKS